MEDLHKELRYAVIGTILLDVLVWLSSLFIMGWSMTVIVGLLLGSAGMLCNLLLLRRTIRNAVYFGKTKDITGYLLRCLIASAVIAAGLMTEQVSAWGAVLPFLYPKFIFGVMAMRKPKK